MTRAQLESDWLERQQANGVKNLDSLSLRIAVSLDLVAAKCRALDAGKIRITAGPLRKPIFDDNYCIAFGRYAEQVYAFRIDREAEEQAYEGLLAMSELDSGS